VSYRRSVVQGRKTNISNTDGRTFARTRVVIAPVVCRRPCECPAYKVHYANVADIRRRTVVGFRGIPPPCCPLSRGGKTIRFYGSAFTRSFDSFMISIVIVLPCPTCLLIFLFAFRSFKSVPYTATLRRSVDHNM